MFIRFVCDLQTPVAMYFLFRLDLSLHAGAGIFFEILIFGTKQCVGTTPQGDFLLDHQSSCHGNQVPAAYNKMPNSIMSHVLRCFVQHRVMDALQKKFQRHEIQGASWPKSRGQHSSCASN